MKTFQDKHLPQKGQSGQFMKFKLHLDVPYNQKPLNIYNTLLQLTKERV